MDQTDGACDFHIDEIDSLKPTQRGGKRKDRVAADRIIDGPVGRGTAEASDDALRFKGFSIENVMAPPPLELGVYASRGAGGRNGV